MTRYIVVTGIALILATSALAQTEAETSEWNEILRDMNADRYTEPYTSLPLELFASHPLWTPGQSSFVRAAQKCDTQSDHICTFEALHALYVSNLGMMTRGCEINQPWIECGPYDVLYETYVTLSLELSQTTDTQTSRRVAEMAISLFDTLAEPSGYVHGAAVYHLLRAEACISMGDLDCALESAQSVEAAIAAKAWWVPVRARFVGAIFAFDMDDALQRITALEADIEKIEE